MSLNPGFSESVSARYIRPLEDFSGGAIEAWISQLPLSDTDGCCEAVCNLLRKLNMTDGIECLERNRIIEQVRPAVVSLLSMSSDRYLPGNTLFPLPSHQRRHLQLTVAMSVEMVNAYRRVITGGAFFSDKALTDAGRALVIYRALQACGLALLKSLEKYESPPLGFWQDSYSFYRLAEGHRLLHLQLQGQEAEGVTIESQFKQILLLALSSHQHYYPDEIRQFYATLLLIAGHANIANLPDEEGEPAYFYFDLDADKAPKLLSKAKQAQSDSRRYLYIAKMLEMAKGIFAVPTYHATDKLKPHADVIIELIQTLGRTERRRYVRRPATGIRLFIVGMDSVIKTVAGEIKRPDMNQVNLECEAPKKPLLSHEELEEEAEIVLGDLDGEGKESIWSKGSTMFHQPPDSPQQSYPGISELEGIYQENLFLPGSLMNISAGGYCLLWLNSSIAGARVGELISVFEDDGWLNLGVIRWLHQRTRAELAIGVELLSPEVRVVSLESQETGVVRKGLYFYANEVLERPASVICAPGKLNSGERLSIKSINNPHPQTFVIHDCLEASYSFEKYTVVASS